MNLSLANYNKLLGFQCQSLLGRMLSPLCGLNEEIGFSSRSYIDPRIIISGAALTGIHVLLNRDNPGRGAYHIGGTGVYWDEAVIRVLGETVERYSQLISEISGNYQLEFCSYNDLIKKYTDVIPIEKLSFFNSFQLNTKGFLFADFSPDLPVSWLSLDSLIENKKMWVPAQLVLVGYQVKSALREPWISPAVTTGTAAHTNGAQALRSALLELIQLDSAMGHWYTNARVYRITRDTRVNNLNRFLLKYAKNFEENYDFYWLPNPDLTSFSVACVYRREKGGLPKVALGLGSDTSLEKAMYKAFLEGVATVGLARLEIFKGEYEKSHLGEFDPTQLFDLDRNVEYYARGYNYARIESRFLKSESLLANDLPPDGSHNVHDDIHNLIDSFKKSNKELFITDMTSVEAESLGFQVIRVWSPDTLSLALPSAVPTQHHRFHAYGGVTHADPHPYA